MLQALAIDVARLGLWLLLLAVLFVPLERLCAIRPAAWWRPGTAADIGFFFINGLVPGVVLAFPLALIAQAAHWALPSAVRDGFAATPLPARIALSFLVAEIGFYWGHRWSHEIPLLWRFHAVHHQPDHLDWLVNTRAHPVDQVFTRLCGLAPLYVLGLASPANGSSSVAPAVVLVAGTIWGFVIHANLRWQLGPLENVVASPAFHHWHHVRTGPINRNYASTLPWLDRAFGTLHLPSGQWPEQYGVADTGGDRPLRQCASSFGIAAEERSGRSRMPAATANAVSSTPAHTA